MPHLAKRRGGMVKTGALPPAPPRLDRQFHFENERGIGPNFPAGSAFAIGEIRGNEKLVLGSGLHHLQRFRPAFDNAIDREARGLTAFVGTVEFRSIEQRPLVMRHDRIGFLRRRTGPFLQHFILHPAGGDFHALLLLVLREEFIPGGRILLRGLLADAAFLSVIPC